MVWKPSKNRSVCLIVTILRAHGYTAEFEFGQWRVLPAQPVFHPQDDRNELYLPTHSWYSVNDSHMTRLFVFSLASLFSGIWVDFRPNVWHRNDYEANIRYSPRKEYLLLSFFHNITSNSTTSDQHTVEKWKLEEVQNHEKRKECIEMDVEAVAPLHILPAWRLNNQVSIRHQPLQSQDTAINIG